MAKKADLRPYFIGLLLIGFVGIVMMAAGDFGGFYYRDSYVDVYGYVGMGTGLVAMALIGAGIAGLGVPVYVAVMHLRGQKRDTKADLRLSLAGASFTASLAAVGALVFILTSLDTDWWLDIGFYGAFVGGLLAAVISWLGLTAAPKR